MMAVNQNAQKSLFDALYCEDEKWVEVDYEGEHHDSDQNTSLRLLEQDLLWDEEELESLFSKEKETTRFKLNETCFVARKAAVEWILKVSARYDFSALIAILAVNYLDRFFCSVSFLQEKPWMMQLVAVTCLSLAAKVEETDAPLLLDLQAEGAAYVFEAKTIQRTELLILSTLKWKMNPVTPLSFLDHIIRRLGLKNHTHWDFLRNCESLLLYVISDSKFLRYLPSTLATATMLHVAHQLEAFNASDYESQLLGVLNICKEEVNDCYNLISKVLLKSIDNINPLKRGFCPVTNSPSGVIDSYFISDSSQDSWTCRSSSHDHHSPFKKRRVQQPQMKLYADFVGSPR